MRLTIRSRMRFFGSASRTVKIALGAAVAIALTVVVVLIAADGEPTPSHPTAGQAGPITAAVPVVVPAACPAETSAVANKAFRPAIGDGPAYMTLGPRTVVGQQVLPYGPSNRAYGGGGYGGQLVSVLVAPSYQERISLRGSGFGTDADLRVGGSPYLLPHAPPLDGGNSPVSLTTDGWRNYSVWISLRLDSPGCYQLTLTGPGLDEQLVFWAEIGTPPGAATPSAPSPTPAPPSCAWGDATAVDWGPFLRLNGQSYLASGMGWFSTSLEPPVSVDPALAGRQVGKVLWDVGDPATNSCYSLLDGSSSVLEAGTPVYTFNGYNESFRLVAETPDGWRVFEADGIAGAKFVGDLLDLRGRVVSVVAEREEQSGNKTLLARIASNEGVSIFLDFILAQPIKLTGGATQPSASDQRVLLTFWLRDGTETARRFYVGGRQMSQGIPLAPDSFTQLEAYLEAAH